MIRSTDPKSAGVLSYISRQPRSLAQMRRHAALDLVDLLGGFRGILLVLMLAATFMGVRSREWLLGMSIAIALTVGELILAIIRRQKRL